MRDMNKSDYQLFKTLVELRDTTLLKTMKTLLRRYYDEDKVFATSEYILCGQGDIPVMLVAHLDTVFTRPPERIYYDRKQRTMWSPQGLGADDRAGVFAIIKILQRGYRPAICFTMGEERGGLGASAMIKDIPTAPFDLKYIIQLDRQGTNDCVFYDCDNEKFNEYVENFGFVTDFGSFSDISEICPAWVIAGVNLSVGYKNEHREIETLNTDALYSTINKVCKMLDDIDNAEFFEYIPDQNPYSGFGYGRFNANYTKFWSTYPYSYRYDDEDEYYHAWSYHNKTTDDYPQEADDYDITTWPATKKNLCQCINCHKSFTLDDLFPVKSRKFKNSINYYCIDCATFGVNWCEKCGEAFEVDTPNDVLCPDCAGKDLPVMEAV